MDDLKVIRVEKNKSNPYVMLDNRVFIDPRLSWKAKGILGYLLSRPDNWRVIVTNLINQSTDGRDSVYAGVKELIKAGYMVKKEVREKGKIAGHEYTVYEQPLENTATYGFSVSGKTVYGKTVYGKTDTNNTNNTNTELTNTYCNIVALLNGFTGKRFKETSGATRKLIDDRLQEGFTEDDFRTVIISKATEWKGTDKEQYLRPSTLFGDKFEGYLNQKKVKEQGNKDTVIKKGTSKYEDLYL